MAAVVARFGLDPQTPAFCYLAALGVPLAFIDVREYRLPDVLTLPSYPPACCCSAWRRRSCPAAPAGSSTR